MFEINENKSKLLYLNDFIYLSLQCGTNLTIYEAFQIYFSFYEQGALMNMGDFIYLALYIEIFLKIRNGDIKEEIMNNIDLFITNP